MMSASAAVLSESQSLNSKPAPTPLSSWTSYRRLRPEPESLPPCVLTDYSETAIWKEVALSKISNLRWLGAGWDGPDSQPIAQIAIERACHIALTVAEHLPNIVPPTILPTHYFGVLLEWYTTARHVAFTVDTDGVIEMDYRDKTRHVEWEGSFEDCADSLWFMVLSDCR